MRNLSPHRITSQQLVYIITGAQVGSAMLALPNLLCEEAGQHGWMAVLVGMLIPLTSVFLIERLGKRMPGHNFVETNQVLLGKIIGTMGVLAFIIHALFFEALLVNAYARLVNIFLLPFTPLWAIIFFAGLCVFYAGSRGGTVVGRINETLFFGMIISMCFILIPVKYSHDVTNLLPLGEIEVAGLLKAALFTAYAYAGTEVLLVLYPQLVDPEKALAAGFKATGISAGIYLLVVIACLLVFGAEGMIAYYWPAITILKIANISVVERLEFYFLAIWVGIVLRRVINLTFCAALSLAQLFRNEKRHALFTLLMVACICTLTLWIPSMTINRELVTYAIYAYLFIGIFYPFFLLGVSWFRKGVT